MQSKTWLDNDVYNVSCKNFEVLVKELLETSDLHGHRMNYEALVATFANGYPI